MKDDFFFQLNYFGSVLVDRYVWFILMMILNFIQLSIYIYYYKK